MKNFVWMQECWLDAFGRGQWRPSGLVCGVFLQCFCCLLTLTGEKMPLQFKKWCFSLFRNLATCFPCCLLGEVYDDVKQMRIAFVIDHFICQLVTDLIQWTNFWWKIWCFMFFQKKNKKQNWCFNSSLLTYVGCYFLILPIKRTCFFLGVVVLS